MESDWSTEVHATLHKGPGDPSGEVLGVHRMKTASVFRRISGFPDADE